MCPEVKSMDKIDIFGVKIDNVTMDSAMEKVALWLTDSKKGRAIFTPNSEIIMAAKKDPEFKEL